MTRPVPVPGTFWRVPLADRSFAYARILEPPYLAFYDYRTEQPSADLELIASKPILFRQAVHISYSKKWKKIGWAELAGEVTRPVVRFRQSIADFRKCVIFDSAGMRKEATPEECVGLERAAAWEPHHIEERLLDSFMGRPNATEQALRVRLK
jgi:hypothetical protein